MGRKFSMSWEGSPNYRWVKMFRGHRYRVSCDDLKSPRTKEGSYQAANDWWQSQLARLRVETIDPERAEQLDALALKLSYAANHAPELVPALEATQQHIRQEPPGEIILDDDTTIRKNLDMARMMGIVVPPDLDPTILQQLFGDRRLWTERLSRVRKTEKDKTISYQLDKFLTEQRQQQKPATHKELALYLKRLMSTEIWTAETSAETIDEQTVTRHYTWLLSQKFSSARHNKVLGFFRRFVEWLWSNKVLADIPRNLKRRNHRKKIVHQEIRQFPNVKETIESLPTPYRLWALLGLNCGMTAADLGVTIWQQIDETHWTLTRRRAKTGENPKTPTVKYKLWPETIAELKKLPRRMGLLFQTSTGKLMYQTFYTDTGGVKIKDLLSLYWKRLDPKPDIPLGKFRSIGTTALKRDKLFRQYEDYYLAHAPRTIADQNYGAEADEPFFEALDFIRKTVLN